MLPFINKTDQTSLNRSGLNKRGKKSFKSIPYDIGNIHFVGIGGIGMSGIAEILHNLGYTVTGSDLNENSVVKRLKAFGIKISKGHDPKNIEGAFVVVKSTAVSYENPEISAARQQSIPVVRRSEMLAELTKLKATVAVSGSHGKTTTTSMIAHLIDFAGLEPTVINGGVINTYGSNAKLGSGEWLVAEADESDGTFIKIPATIGVVTNIDPEHMDYWKDFDDLKNAFEEFLGNLPFYGFAVLNDDHEEVVRLKNNLTDRKFYTYTTLAENVDSDIRLLDCKEFKNKSVFKVLINRSISNQPIEEEFEIPSIGRHNVSNAMAALCVGVGIGIELEVIKQAFKEFAGVKRRFTILGERREAIIVDDYAHHPVEITASLNSAKQYINGSGGRIIAVMQPHRYTRLRDLFDDFVNSLDNADEIIVTQMYSAGEDEIKDINQFTFAEKLRDKGKNAIALNDDSKLKEILRQKVQKNDLVICMGAGTITNYAADIVENL